MSELSGWRLSSGTHCPVDKCESFESFRCMSLPCNICKCAIFLCQLSGRANPTFTRMRRERGRDASPHCNFHLNRLHPWKSYSIYITFQWQKTITIELTVRLFHGAHLLLHPALVWATRAAMSQTNRGNGFSALLKSGTGSNYHLPIGMLRNASYMVVYAYETFHEGHLWIKHIWVSFLPSQPAVPPEWRHVQNDKWSENTGPDSRDKYQRLPKYISKYLRILY